MKLFKMSLATVVALGALSSVASATPLEEAIKDIDVSGFGRYRYDSRRVKPNNADSISNATHRFTLDVNFKATLDDNFFSVVGIRYNSYDASGSHRGGTFYGDGRSNVKDSLNVRQYYLGYQISDFTLTAGRQLLGTYFTDDMVGTGIKGVYSGVQGLTIAALAMDDLEDDEDISSTGLGQVVGARKGTMGGYTYQQNLYGVAVLGDYDIVNFQVWWAFLQNVTHLYALDLGLNYDVNEDFNIHAKLNVAGNSFTGKFKDDVKAALNTTSDVANNNVFFGITAGLSAYGFDLDAGYLTYGKKDRASLVSFEDQGGFISPGEDLLDYTLYDGKHKYWFLTALYTYDNKYSIGADYVQGDVKREGLEKEKRRELVGRLGYKYNEKLNFKAWYSWIEEKQGGVKNKTDHFRFEARYNF